MALRGTPPPHPAPWFIKSLFIGCFSWTRPAALLRALFLPSSGWWCEWEETQLSGREGVEGGAAAGSVGLWAPLPGFGGSTAGAGCTQGRLREADPGGKQKEGGEGWGWGAPPGWAEGPAEASG